MKPLRWMVAFPAALVLSITAWFLLLAILGSGGGYASVLIRASLPTALFVISAVLLSPSKGRKVAFTFFGISLLISGGGMELLQYDQLGIVEFWVASFVGVIIGALAGLAGALRFQDSRTRKRPTQGPEP